MATKLEEYQQLKESLKEQLNKGEMDINNLIYLCEINYRIEVLEEFQLFYRTTPDIMDEDKFSFHFQFIKIFVNIILKEKRFAKIKDEAGEARKEAAKTYLKNVIESGEEQLNRLSITSVEEYKKYISSYCNTVLIAWLQMREAFIQIEGGIQNGTVNR